MAAPSPAMRLLALDPELAERVSAADLAAASAAAVAPELRLPCGAWEAERIPRTQRSALGLLVLSGIVARDVSLAGHTCTELLGAGDIVHPWIPPGVDSLLPTSTQWTVLEPLRIAVLTPEFLTRISTWPELVDAFFLRANRRCLRLGIHHAIAQLPRVDLRLLALFWHLAERWGRIGRDGVVLPVSLPHHMLGRLVGARRPTVSLALRELAERGHVRRRDDGSWQLARAAPGVLEPLRSEPARGALIPAPAGAGEGVPARDLDAVDRMAAELFLRIRRVRELAAERADQPSASPSP